MMKKINIKSADLWLITAVCSYFVMNGAQIWETAVLIPAWTEAPPASLIFFQQPYGLNLKTFWIVMHTINDVLFIWALIFNWQLKERRNFLIPLFIIHLGIRTWTVHYFAQEIIFFQNITHSFALNPELVERADKWKMWNYLRVALFFMINFSLIPVYFRRKDKNEIYS